MATFSYVDLDLPVELKRRIAALVRGTGKTPHAFMVEAIEAETRLAEQRRQPRRKRSHG